jgi:hypothetical protein
MLERWALGSSFERALWSAIAFFIAASFFPAVGTDLPSNGMVVDSCSLWCMLWVGGWRWLG